MAHARRRLTLQACATEATERRLPVGIRQHDLLEAIVLGVGPGGQTIA
jgi:hypothetical protein